MMLLSLCCSHTAALTLWALKLVFSHRCLHTLMLSNVWLSTAAFKLMQPCTAAFCCAALIPLLAHRWCHYVAFPVMLSRCCSTTCLHTTASTHCLQNLSHTAVLTLALTAFFTATIAPPLSDPQHIMFLFSLSIKSLLMLLLFTLPLFALLLALNFTPTVALSLCCFRTTPFALLLA